MADNTEVDSAGNPVTYGSNTKDINEATGAPKGAPVLAGGFSDFIGSLNPIQTLKDTVSKTADIGVNQANANTGAFGTTAETPIITPEQQQLLDMGKGLPKAAQGAGEAIGQIGETQNALGAPVGQQAQETNTQQGQFSQGTDQDELQKSVAQFSNVMQSKQNDLDQMKQQIAINPQEAVRQQYFGTAGHAVMSSIAMALSGIGSGLTGQPNAALSVYQKSIDRAVQQKAQNIQAYMESAQGKQLIADSQLSKAQQVALANNIATSTVYHAAEGAILGNQYLIKSKTAPAVSRILQADAVQKYTQAGAEIVKPFIGRGTQSDARALNAAGLWMSDIPVGKTLNLRTNPNQVAPTNNTQAPTSLNPIEEKNALKDPSFLESYNRLKEGD